MRFRRPLLTLLCVSAILWSWPALAQEQTGSIQGSVKDAQGGVLPGVTVEARSVTAVGVNTSLLRKSDPPMFGRNGPCVRHDQDLCGVDWRTVGVPA